MSGFELIKGALQYIDAHLDEELDYETVANHCHISPFYFHRMFSLIAGKTITAHIRDRRLTRACQQLTSSQKSVIEIGLDCGYGSAGSFSRVFKGTYGLTPSEYRRQGYSPVIVSAEELIMRFTNRIKGGIYVNPKIIKQKMLYIAGVSGDGDKTGEVWGRFTTLCKEKPVKGKLSDNGYEVRFNDGQDCKVHVGCAVADASAAEGYEVASLPQSVYAVFDVYVEKGYDSENDAINEWLASNAEGYKEKLLDGKHYCVEYYDERFNFSEAGSIVELWIPVEKTI